MTASAETIQMTYMAGARGGFADPTDDYAGTQTPTTLDQILRWCELLWMNDGTYRMAMERVVSYFLTDVQINEVTDEIKEKYENFLSDKLKIMSKLRIIGLDFMCYGNSFTSLYVPFRRYLVCKSCGVERPIDQINYRFVNYKFLATCIACKHEGDMDRRDRRSNEADKAEIIRWDPHAIKLLFHPLTHKTKYLYQIPADIKKHVLRGTPFYVNALPWEFIEAVRDNRAFMFNDDVVFHMKEETLAGVSNRGWGVPRALSNFKQAWYIQVLRRYNEALALDYIVPWRVLTPSPGSSREADPLMHLNQAGFVSRLEDMVRKHRRDPADVNVLPFPLEYQALGGEAKALAPHELLTTATDELLNAAGVPSELYRGTLSLQAVPTSLRLFESTWPHLTAQFNAWLEWLMQGLSRLFSWDPATACLEPVTHADDIESRSIRLQLASANQISLQSAFRPLGINIREEIDRKFEEMRMMSDKQREFDREQSERGLMEQRVAETATIRQQAQSGGSPGSPMPPGMPGGPGAASMLPSAALGSSGGPTTPQDLQNQAASLAQQLIGMPEAARRSQLIDIKKSDPTLHALVRAGLENIRSSARSEGQEMVLSQTQGMGQM